jgi:hypothetical protein
MDYMGFGEYYGCYTITGNFLDIFGQRLKELNLSAQLVFF